MLDVFDTQERQAVLEQALESARKKKDEKNFNLVDERESLDLKLAREKEEEGKLKAEMKKAQREASIEKKAELKQKQKENKLKQL